MLKLCFLLHLTQVSSGLKTSSSSSSLSVSKDPENKAVQRLLAKFGKGQICSATELKTKSLRWLKSVAIFFHFYTDVPLINHRKMSYEELTEYLGLPTSLHDLLCDSGVELLTDSWSNYAKNVDVSLPTGPRNLIELPNDYITLLNKAAQYRCPNNVTGECKSPVMCLVCAEIICSQVRIICDEHYKSKQWVKLYILCYHHQQP